MKAIQVLALEDLSSEEAAKSTRVPLDRLDEIAAGLARAFRISCHVNEEPLDISFALDTQRRQYYATAILARMNPAAAAGTHVLGVTAGDLYVPVLTFVFGEAQVGGPRAIISEHRLREEFYGLPANPRVQAERLTKAALHELGHTFGLEHCMQWSCVMASTHAVERLDIKEAAFCPACRRCLNFLLWH
jgi:archaemetzincin